MRPWAASLPLTLTVLALRTGRAEFRRTGSALGFAPNILAFTITADNWMDPISIQIRATEDDIVEALVGRCSLTPG